MLDILAIAAHPDDADIGCGGTLALLGARGYKTGVLDLTEGEMGTQGTVDTRRAESAKASAVLGLSARENLALPDGGLDEMNETQAKALVGAIRKFRPELLILPYWEDRHPDHCQASLLSTRAVFLSGLSKYFPELGTPHKVLQTAYYPFRTFCTPSFLVNVTEFYDKKLEAIRAFSSQIQRETGTTGTLISSPLSISSLNARDEYYGSMLGVKFAEPFLVKTAIGVSDPLAFFRANPVREPLASPGVSSR